MVLFLFEQTDQKLNRWLSYYVARLVVSSLRSWVLQHEVNMAIIQLYLEGNSNTWNATLVMLVEPPVQTGDMSYQYL